MTRYRAAFLDRDGVINVDHGYVHEIERFELLSGAVEGLRCLQRSGHALVVVTNQSGIARGHYSESQYLELTIRMQTQLATAGVRLAGVYHCPHHPDAEDARYRADCRCRKPAPGLLLAAGRHLHIDLARSIMIGDRASDIAAGRRAGVGRCYLIGTAQHDAAQQADAVYPDLLACARAVCEASCEA